MDGVEAVGGRCRSGWAPKGVGGWGRRAFQTMGQARVLDDGAGDGSHQGTAEGRRRTPCEATTGRRGVQLCQSTTPTLPLSQGTAGRAHGTGHSHSSPHMPSAFSVSRCMLKCDPCSYSNSLYSCASTAMPVTPSASQHCATTAAAGRAGGAGFRKSAQHTSCCRRQIATTAADACEWHRHYTPKPPAFVHCLLPLAVAEAEARRVELPRVSHLHKQPAVGVGLGKAGGPLPPQPLEVRSVPAPQC